MWRSVSLSKVMWQSSQKFVNKLELEFNGNDIFESKLNYKVCF